MQFRPGDIIRISNLKFRLYGYTGIVIRVVNSNAYETSIIDIREYSHNMVLIGSHILPNKIYPGDNLEIELDPLRLEVARYVFPMGIR